MKLTLAVLSGSLSDRQFELETGSLTLGRRADSNLHFDREIDSGVSNLHATIQSYPDGFYIRDQQSTNGTFVNGISVKEAWLKSGDSIRLAREGPEIRAIIEDHTAPTPAEETLPPPPTMRGSIGQTITNIGYYNPIKKDKESHHVGLWIGLGIAFFVGLIVAVVMIASLGFVGALVGALMAFTPAPCYLLVYWWIDRYDPEPVWAIAGAFGWGALFALLVSFVVNTAFGTVAAALIGGPGGDTLAAIVSAPLIEEGTKGLGVVMILVFLRKEFDGVLDGIVYAGVIALGFATGENVLYYGRSFNEDGFNGLLLTAFLRGVLSPFAHSFFTAMTGIGCGISRETHNKALRILMPIIGYFCAVFLHSMWNTVASIAKDFFIVAYLAIWVPLFVLFMILIIVMAVRERRIIRQMLDFEVATGTLSQQELDLVGSMGARAKWMMEAFSNRHKWNARRKFLRAVSKLGFCYWHVSRANAAHNQTISLPQIPKFKAEIAALRPQL